MSKTTSISPAPGSSQAPPAPASPVTTAPIAAPSIPIEKTRSAGWYLQQGLKALASLRFTVVLFVLSLLLVFFGTLAQIDNGIWTVVNGYFRWFWVWVPFRLFGQFGGVFFEFLGFPRGMNIPGSFPFPGGLTLGILLLVNLLAAHAIRFKLSWKRSGIFLIHGGLILMLLGEFIAYFSVEGRMTIEEGETTNAVVVPRQTELAVIRPDDTNKDLDRVTVVPSDILRSGVVKSDELPFDVEVVKWFVNGAVRDARPDDSNPATKGIGLDTVAYERGEVSGVDSNQSVEVPACYLKVTKKDGSDLGTWLMWAAFKRGQPITVDGKTYEVALRLKQSYKPFSMKLLEFRFDRYAGTETPKNFSSKVHLLDPETGDDRDVVIRMNEPLRHRGETFYQADWNKETEHGTVLQVVRNPGWLLPYFSCAIVSLGMILHFGLNLATFLQRRSGS
jgi:hypothetical protein